MKKNWVLVILGFVIIAMAVGYAALSEELNIFGTANIDASWQIEFTNIVVTDSHQATSVEATYASTTAIFEVDLHAPGGYVDYLITISNNGTIDAKIDKIWVDRTLDVLDIQFEGEGIEEGDLLNAGETNQVIVRVAWDPIATSVPQAPDAVTDTIYAQIFYVQNTN